MRLATIGVLACAIIGLCAAAEGWAAMKRTTDVEAQELGPALELLAKEHGFQVLYRTELVARHRAPRVHGELSTEDALRQLLQGSGLTFRYLGERAVTIVPVPGAGGTGSTLSAPESSSGEGSAEEERSARRGGTFWDRLAQAGPELPTAAAAPQSRAEKTTGESPALLQEVVVTAQKREERLQDVPVPVTAISAESLVDQGQLRLQDYYAEIPGLSASLNNSGAPNLAIRGLTTGDGTNPTVGIVVDDVPYGSSTILGSGSAVPDIDPSDLARIEVLRGPQGTLYGASSIGGLLKFVTVDPSSDALQGHIQAGTFSVHDGVQTGYLVRAAGNIPLSDAAALRVSGFYRRDPGYIDDVQTGEKGVNRGDADGARASLLWKPLSSLTVKLSALFQDNRTYGSPNVTIEPGLHDLQQDALKDSGGYNNKIQSYTATVTAKLAGFDLTSLSGYSVNKTFLPQDLTPAFGPFTQTQFGVGSTLTLFEADTSKYSEELRLSTTFGDRLEWLLGVFYTHENSPIVAPILAVDTTTLAPAGSWLDNRTAATYAEYAAFTDLTIHFTNAFDVQIGGRESHNDQSYSQVEAGPYVTTFLGLPSPLIQPQIRTHDNSSTYLVTPRLRLSPDLMLYARLASGYRPGGPNTLSTAFHAPRSFDPDKTQNYEIGVKGSAWDRVLSFDASVYRIDWKDIQLLVIDPVSFASYTANGSHAKSQGVELSMSARPLTGLSLGAWASWNTAVLTESLPVISSVFGADGDRLPYAPRFSGSLSIQQEVPIRGELRSSVGAVLSYVGNREGEFAAVASGSPQRQLFGGYAQADVHVGVKYESWGVNAYVNNVADRRGVLDGGLNFFPPNAFNYIRPRTVGLSFTKDF